MPTTHERDVDEQREVVGAHDAEAGGVAVPEQHRGEPGADEPDEPRPPIGTSRSAGRNASATIVTIAVSVTMRIGMIA